MKDDRNVDILEKCMHCMIGAYIMILASPGTVNGIVKELRKIEQIENISVITGEYDIVVRVTVEDMQKLADITDMINLIDGVSKTHTHVIMREQRA